jgi:serine/threonine protein kinase, bacterial
MIGKLLDHRYQVIRVLATGGFGQTYIAQDTKRPNHPICVVKHLKPATSDPKIFETAKRLFHNEAETLEQLGNHDQIPRLLAYFDENQEFYLVQEFIEGHPLSDELLPGQRWSESEVVTLLQEVLTILEFVHRQGVIHRDIKPDNIIRRASDNKLVLVDFGAVKQLQRPMVTTAGQFSATVAIGTPGYMSTEQGQGKPRPNSDIYALGVIAIQALTGISPMELQDDQDTGEFLWQHLVKVNSPLAAVLTKMVRYHFKDRYQSVTEALEACKDLTNLISKTSISGEYAQNSSYQQVKSQSPPSRVQTVAFAPANPVAAKLKRKEPRFDPLPLVIAALLAGGAATGATYAVKNLKNFDFNFATNGTTDAKYCMAVVTGNSNVRSEPSSLNSGTIVETIDNDTRFEVTGKRTKLGWVEVKLDSGSSAWVNSTVIRNKEQWVSCLRDKGIAIKTVDDSALIALRQISKPQPKSPVVATPSPTPEPTLEKSNPFNPNPFTSESGKSEPLNSTSKNPEQSTPKENSAKVVEQAKEKYESGDLQGAIALLQSVPKNASDSWQETTKMVAQWQQDWAKAEAISNEINQAIDNGQWDKVLAIKDHPEKLPNIQYWRDKIDPLFQEAADNLAKQVSPKAEQPDNQNPFQRLFPNFDNSGKTESKNHKKNHEKGL